MWGVFIRFIKDKSNMVMWFCIGALGFIEMYVALFPVLKDQSAELDKLLEAYPKGFMEAFGFDGTTSMFSQLETYMSTEYFSFFWVILVIIMAISFANAICISEIEKGTIDLSLSQPISRTKLLLTRFFAGTLAVSLFTLVSSYGILGAAMLHNIEYKIQNYATISIMGILCGLAILSMATFFSVLFSEKGRAIVATTTIILLMYAVNIVAGLNDKFESLKYLSFFHYFDAPKIFGNNIIPEWSIQVFVGTTLFFLIAAIWRFQKRDIAT